MPQIQRSDRQNPTFAHASTGVAANHSTTTPSTQHSEPHPQADDAANDTDSNIADTRPTNELYHWAAGRMEGWQENDDYRRHFENGRSAEGLYGYSHDNDYDDNGGIPTRIGHG